MSIRSVRLNQGLLLASVVALVVLAFFNIYISKLIESSEIRYQLVLNLHKSFVDLVVLEGKVRADNGIYGELIRDQLDLAERMKGESERISPIYLSEREHVVATMLQTIRENAKKYSELQKTLPSLIENVRYIHQYHVIKLKSALQRGQSIRFPNDDHEFVRSDEEAAPELEIINGALQVQNRLVDVVALFYEMQVATNMQEVEPLFAKRMDLLYEAINRFDDYTLDAQDGLLVEELLLTGKTFQDAFSLLLKNNRKIALLQNKLDANEHQITQMFDDAAQRLLETKESSKQRFHLVQQLSIGVLLLLACWLIYYGVHLSRAFIRTISELGKIGNDLTYRIAKTTQNYQEFETIHETLNTLAETAETKVRSLESMQRELGLRVQERTAELVHMNTRLKNEIADRIKADDSRRELEERLIRAKKMEAVGTLAGGVAHDLNNILSGVVTYPELLLMDIKESDKLYQPLNSIKRSGERAAAIVQDLLTLARRGVAVSEIVGFRDIVMEFIESSEFRSAAQNHPDVTIDLQLDESTGNIKGSRLHLQKAVMNIIINGMEAMPDGGRLTLSSRPIYVDTTHKGYDTVKEGDYVCFSVTDTGVGMTEEVSAQIFEPFFTRKQMGRRSGTGLGMAVVYSTIKDHGGAIDVHSEVGVGTSITIYLPLCREDTSELPHTKDVQDMYGEGQHLLVVDDIFEQRQIASAMLQRLNYTVATAASGEEAVAYARDNEVDLVVLDMIMPGGMDGLDTFLALKAVTPNIKVIIASGYSESERVHRAQSAGAGRYIKKPYSMEALGGAIHSALNI